ncbi:MAG: zinc ribbon domain-containing protein [Chloroflexi bacterium]|nr:zinc ribbon domain-containing protein [Chloroflexota bacterium]
MPVYEYRCTSCGRVSSVLVRSLRAAIDPVCEGCGARDLQRRISTVGRVRSAHDAADEFRPPDAGDSYRDPRQIGRWVERRFEEYGVDVPAEARDMIDRARDGDLPADL